MRRYKIAAIGAGNIGGAGVERIVELALADEERDALHRSAQTVREQIGELGSGG